MSSDESEGIFEEEEDEEGVEDHHSEAEVVAVLEREGEGEIKLTKS